VPKSFASYSEGRSGDMSRSGLIRRPQPLNCDLPPWNDSLPARMTLDRTDPVRSSITARGDELAAARRPGGRSGAGRGLADPEHLDANYRPGGQCLVAAEVSWSTGADTDSARSLRLLHFAAAPGSIRPAAWRSFPALPLCGPSRVRPPATGPPVAANDWPMTAVFW
jgi:hypothetical protein